LSDKELRDLEESMNNNQDENHQEEPPPLNKETPEAEIKAESADEQFEKLKSEHLYLKAEFENYKRNMIKERSNLVKFGSERIINEILSVLDNFYRALEMEVTEENYSAFKEGVSLTSHEFEKALQNFGVENIACDTETMFDPNVHEALSSEPTDKVKAGYISSVFRKGYKLHNKVIRAAQVVVAREPDVPKKEDIEDSASDENTE